MAKSKPQAPSLPAHQDAPEGVPAIQPCPDGRYMNEQQLDWFRRLLENQLAECDVSIACISDAGPQDAPEGDEADLADYKTQATQQGMQADRLHSRRREIMLALRRIEADEFGYCEQTGEEIGLARLKANPVAQLCIEAQQRKELVSRTIGRH